MRVTFLNPIGKIGGAERSMLGLMTGIRRVAPEVHLGLIAAQDGPLLRQAEQLGVETLVVALGDRPTRLGDHQTNLRGIGATAKRVEVLVRCLAAAPEVMFYSRKLRGAILATCPDVVHSNGFKMHLLSAYSTPKGIPVVWHVHDYVSARPLMRRLLHINVRRSAALVGVSQSVVADARSALDCGRVPVHCVYNSVDPQMFSSEGACVDLDRLAGVPPAPAGTIRVGLVATFARWKGHETFLSAVAAIPRSLPVRAYIVGAPIYATDGSQYSMEELKAICRNLAVEDRVAFTGFCERPAEAIRSLDILVHASVAPEPFGMVLVEAMSASRALITTASGGAAELCTDGVDACVCRPADSAGMARQIITLVQDANLRRRLSEAARIRAAEMFKPERAAGEVLSLYRTVIGTPPLPKLKSAAAIAANHATERSGSTVS